MNELTDVCEGNEGFIYPIPPITEGCDSSYHDEIVAVLTADGTPSLEGLNTTSRAITCTLIRIVVDVGSGPESMTWRLDAGAANGSDDGQVAPTDYNATTNNKHWTKVGG